jgi:XTP/dITP diphosphohydrolase
VPALQRRHGGRQIVRPIEKLLVATTNRGKREEIRALLGDLRLEIVDGDEASWPPIEEIGETYAENALAKARAAARATGMAALADDSGLEVDALEGAPGVHSARFAGPAATAAANNRLLLARLEGVPRAARTARFVCVAALVLTDGREIVTRGSVEGVILEAPRGDGGFGYDPLFYCPPLGATFGEAEAPAKNAVSHRAGALRALAERLRALYDAEGEG